MPNLHIICNLNITIISINFSGAYPFILKRKTVVIYLTLTYLLNKYPSLSGNYNCYILNCFVILNKFELFLTTNDCTDNNSIYQVLYIFNLPQSNKYTLFMDTCFHVKI